MGEVAEIKWPEEYNELTKIEELLHCRICYEYINTSVITPCSHNYCSICIRKFLHYKTQCPVCFENIYAKDLYANRILDEFTSHYLSLREKLFSCIKRADLNVETANVTPVRNHAASINSRSSTQTRKTLFKDSPSSSRNGLTPKQSPRIDSDFVNTPNKKIPSSNSASNTPKINSIFTSLNHKKNVPNIINNKKVPCPVCATDIPEANINRHLDDCLKRQRSMTPPKDTKNCLKPLRKYVTNLMKDSELRKLLKEYSLSTSGTRKALEKRLQRFSTIYNAERDKIAPKSIGEIVKLCEAEEVAEKNIASQNLPNLIQNIDRKMDQNVIEKYQKQYREKNKDEFQKLIDSISDRERNRPEPKSSLFQSKNVEYRGEASSSRTSDQSGDNIDDSFMEIGESPRCSQSLDDSDSTTRSYPLQHYSGDDPTKYLSMEISRDREEASVKLEPNSSGGNDTWRVKSEPAEESSYSSIGINQSDAAASGSISTPSIENYGNSFATRLSDAGAENTESSDTGDEVDEGDLASGESEGNGSERLIIERTKTEKKRFSSDTESDSDFIAEFANKKFKKGTKRGEEKGREESIDNGEKTGGEVISPIENNETEISSRSCISGKGNTEIDNENCENYDRTSLRRSSRKRGNVYYSVNIRGKKNIDEISSNSKKAEKYNKEVKTLREINEVEVKSKILTETSDQKPNAATRSLRKRCKH